MWGNPWSILLLCSSKFSRESKRDSTFTIEVNTLTYLITMRLVEDILLQLILQGDGFTYRSATFHPICAHNFVTPCCTVTHVEPWWLSYSCSYHHAAHYLSFPLSHSSSCCPCSCAHHASSCYLIHQHDVHYKDGLYIFFKPCNYTYYRLCSIMIWDRSFLSFFITMLRSWKCISVGSLESFSS